MLSKLSNSQRQIVECDKNRMIVKACPGSGKTFSVAARLARIIDNNHLSRHQGIATISFTNTACEEILKGLKSEYGISEIGYPNFVGTIDSFVNNYIFLPYGHLIMGCDQRPEIVGTEYNKWFGYDTSKSRSIVNNGQRIITYREPNYYFDKVTFNISNTIVPIMPPTSYHFSWKETHKKDGTYKAVIQEIIDMKLAQYRNGIANQSDANYIALKILQKFPAVARNIAERFPILIIDEAQDTTETQMAIIDILDTIGIESIMLIGDPYQAIFEWNTAVPSLFLDKYNSDKWHSIELMENWRCSSNICSVINNFFGGNMQSVSISKNCVEVPEILPHQTNPESINSIVGGFLDKCKELGIDNNSCAIVYRGRSFGERYFNQSDEANNADNSMWTNGKYYVRDIAQGKYLIETGHSKKGLHLIEKGVLKLRKNVAYISTKDIRNEIEEKGFRKYREIICGLAESIPSTNQNLRTWISECKKLGLNLETNNAKSDIQIPQIFSNNIACTNQTVYKTIHSVKGSTLDAILVFLVKKDHSNYSTILPKDYGALDAPSQEQLRIVYVACSRPKRLLWIAVPAEDVQCWSDKLIKQQ